MELMPNAKSRERSLERASEEQRTSYVRQKSNKLGTILSHVTVKNLVKWHRIVTIFKF